MFVNSDRSEQIWLLLYIVIPLVLFAPLSALFNVSGATQTLISGLMGILAALSGFGMYFYTRKNNLLIRSLVLVGIVSVAILLMTQFDLYSIRDFYQISQRNS